MTMLQTKFMDAYIDYGSDAGVFMSTLLFPLTCGFSDTHEILDFKVCLYASIYINHYYVEYYKKFEDYDLNVFSSTERGEVKKYSAFLSLSILEEIQCLAVSLLYLMSENQNFNSSCITTAGNETFHGRLKSFLSGDETVTRCISSLGKFVLGEILGSRIVKE